MEIRSSLEKYLIKIPDSEYFNREELSNSDLVKYSEEGYENFLLYKNKEQPKSDAFVFGSLVHTLILEPEEFDKRYHILSGELPNSTNSDMFCKMYAETKENITDIYKKCYSVNSKSDKEILKAASDLYYRYVHYIDFLIENEKKEIITVENYEEALNCAEIVKDTNYWKTISELSKKDNYADFKEYAIIFSTMSEDGFLIKMRCKLDRLVVFYNSLEDTYEFEYIDIKTTRNASLPAFQKSFYNYKYDWQLYNYNKAIKHICNQCNIINYKIHNVIIAVQKGELNIVKVYAISEDSINQAGKAVETCINAYANDFYEYHKKENNSIFNGVL